MEKQKRAIRPEIWELTQSTRHYSMHGKMAKPTINARAMWWRHKI
jgi:hypothetical protein